MSLLSSLSALSHPCLLLSSAVTLPLLSSLTQPLPFCLTPALCCHPCSLPHSYSLPHPALCLTPAHCLNPAFCSTPALCYHLLSLCSLPHPSSLSQPCLLPHPCPLLSPAVIPVHQNTQPLGPIATHPPRSVLRLGRAQLLWEGPENQCQLWYSCRRVMAINTTEDRPGEEQGHQLGGKAEVDPG